MRRVNSSVQHCLFGSSLSACHPAVGCGLRRGSTSAMPSPTVLDKKSCIVPREAYDALCTASRVAEPTQAHGPPVAQSPTTTSGCDAPLPPTTGTSGAAAALQPPPPPALRRHGSFMSITAVGVVSAVQHGRLLGGVEVLQCVLKTRGYRTRQPGDLKMFQNEFLVRLRGDWANGTLLEGSRVVMRGTLSLHTTYDMVSKSSFENPVLDVGNDGYVGVLFTPPPCAKAQ